MISRSMPRLAKSRGLPVKRREVESQLAQSTSGDRFLAEPAVAGATQMITNPGARVLIGRRVGVYHLQMSLGAGGMGEVYRAGIRSLGVTSQSKSCLTRSPLIQIGSRG